MLSHEGNSAELLRRAGRGDHIAFAQLTAP
jgi:hypothetical protein